MSIVARTLMAIGLIWFAGTVAFFGALLAFASLYLPGHSILPPSDAVKFFASATLIAWTAIWLGATYAWPGLVALALGGALEWVIARRSR